MSGRFLLTGATGFLGREVLVRLLARGHDVLVTTRPRPDEAEATARARLAAIIEATSPGISLERLTVVHADVTAPDLAFSPGAAAWLANGDAPIQIVHGAAEVRFDLPYAVMETQNVTGTGHVLALAKKLAAEGRLSRVDHVSTAFVAGDRTDLALEKDGDVGQKPRNAYEATKLAAEKLVAVARSEGLPIAVHRPSIIVGDSRTGRASSFKVLYWPLKVYARGRFRTIFGRPDCRVDVVPVDYVADALLCLFDEPRAVGGCFHLAAGPRASTIAALAAVAERVFERGSVRYIDPDFYLRWIRPVLRPILRLVRPEIAERGGVYLPYLKANPIFDTRGAIELLQPRGVEPPAVEGYFETILRFAKETDFGRAAPKQDPAT